MTGLCWSSCIFSLFLKIKTVKISLNLFLAAHNYSVPMCVQITITHFTVKKNYSYSFKALVLGKREHLVISNSSIWVQPEWNSVFNSSHNIHVWLFYSGSTRRTTPSSPSTRDTGSSILCSLSSSCILALSGRSGNKYKTTWLSPFRRTPPPLDFSVCERRCHHFLFLYSLSLLHFRRTQSDVL